MVTTPSSLDPANVLTELRKYPHDIDRCGRRERRIRSVQAVAATITADNLSTQNKDLHIVVVVAAAAAAVAAAAVVVVVCLSMIGD